MNYMDGIIPTSAISKSEDVKNNNKIINEAIILDALNGDTKALNEFYSNLGRFGVRDGILNESNELCTKLCELEKVSCPETAAVLACAKEKNCVDYILYTRCMCIMNKCLENMKADFHNIAKTRVEEQTKELIDNARVKDALDKTIESCCKQ